MLRALTCTFLMITCLAPIDPAAAAIAVAPPSANTSTNTGTAATIGSSDVVWRHKIRIRRKIRRPMISTRESVHRKRAKRLGLTITPREARLDGESELDRLNRLRAERQNVTVVPHVMSYPHAPERFGMLTLGDAIDRLMPYRRHCLYYPGGYPTRIGAPGRVH